MEDKENITNPREDRKGETNKYTIENKIEEVNIFHPPKQRKCKLIGHIYLIQRLSIGLFTSILY